MVVHLDSSPSYLIYICPCSHQSLVGEQYIWKPTLGLPRTTNILTFYTILNVNYHIKNVLFQKNYSFYAYEMNKDVSAVI